MIIRKFAIVALLAGGLTACAAAPSYETGNFVAPSTLANLNETIVSDTVKQLIALYPPASTRFDFGQPATDAYGTRLVQSLRQSGYALSEFVPAAGVNGTNQDGAVFVSPGLSLRYVVDSPAGLSLYRITVLVGAGSLSRAYTAHDNTVSPAGAWARRE